MTKVEHRYFIKLKGAPAQCYAAGKSLGTIPLALTHEEVRQDHKGILSRVANGFIREVDCHGNPVRSDDDEALFRKAIRERRDAKIRELDRKGRRSAYAAAGKDTEAPEEVPEAKPYAELPDASEPDDDEPEAAEPDDEDDEEESVDEDPSPAEEDEGTPADDAAAAPADDGETYDLTLLDQNAKDACRDIEEIDDLGWLRRLLQAEEDGKTRVTVTRALEGRIGDLEG